MTNSHALFSLLILLVCVTTFTKTWGGGSKIVRVSLNPTYTLFHTQGDF